jgi:thymidylate synthase (FAD)
MIKVTYIDSMGSDLTTVNAARVSFNKVKDVLDIKDEKLIEYLANERHMSPFEHLAMTVLVECPLYIRSQIHRHRTFSYNEISRRYTSENIEFYIPERLGAQHKTSRQCSDGVISNEANKHWRDFLRRYYEITKSFYDSMIAEGISREDARGILPTSMMTKFWMTGNLRNWIHFYILRSDSHAQRESQFIAEEVLKLLVDKFPKSVNALIEASKKCS